MCICLGKINFGILKNEYLWPITLTGLPTANQPLPARSRSRTSRWRCVCSWSCQCSGGRSAMSSVLSFSCSTCGTMDARSRIIGLAADWIVLHSSIYYRGSRPSKEPSQWYIGNRRQNLLMRILAIFFFTGVLVFYHLTLSILPFSCVFFQIERTNGSIFIEVF